jgi:hypothetical protein
MATDKTRFVFHAGAYLAEKIKAASAESGAPIAEVIRRALLLQLAGTSRVEKRDHTPVLIPAGFGSAK